MKKRDEILDLANLPPLENLDPDELKLFAKEELISYLEYYGMCVLFFKKNNDLKEIEPAETKPDLKKQMRTLIMNVKSGVVLKRPGIGVEFQKNRSNIASNYTNKLLNSRILNGNNLKLHSIGENTNQQSIPRSELIGDKIDYIERSLDDIHDNIIPYSMEYKDSSLLNDISYYYKSFSSKLDHLKSPGSDYYFNQLNDFRNNASYISDDLTCTGCGKRANREVDY